MLISGISVFLPPFLYVILVGNELKFPVWFVDRARWTWSGNLLGELKYSWEDSPDLEFAFFSFIFSPVINLIGRQVKKEWGGKRVCEGLSLSSYPSILQAVQHGLQIMLHKSEDSCRFHRESISETYTQGFILPKHCSKWTGTTQVSKSFWLGNQWEMIGGLAIFMYGL